MTVSRRHASPLATGLVLGVAAWGIAMFPAAPVFAADVTNPADHPSPVTITIDGQEFHDGLDTLPGFDDYACTAIPGVEYDFPNNRVLYYDDANKLVDQAKWTEWDRITSYQTWVKQQSAAATPTPSAPSSSSSQGSSSPSSSDTSAPAGSAPSTSSQSSSAPSTQSASAPAASAGATTSGSSTKSTGSSKPASTSSSSGGKTSASASSGSSAKGSTASAAGAAGTSAPAAASTVDGASSDEPAATSAGDAAASTPASTDGTAPQASDDVVVRSTEIAGPPAPAGIAADPKAKALPGVAAEDGNTTLAGVGILGALSLAGLALLSGNFVRRHALGGKGPTS